MKQLIQMAREKEEQVTQLQAEYDRLPHDVNRGLYTRRIIEIIKNVKKQQIDIDKVRRYSSSIDGWLFAERLTVNVWSW